jgi:hypothetical protein
MFLAMLAYIRPSKNMSIYTTLKIQRNRNTAMDKNKSSGIVFFLDLIKNL